MQSFRSCTVHIRTVVDKISDSSQALGIARFQSRVFVDDETMVIIWTKREIDVRSYSWRGLVCEHRTVNKLGYEIRPNTHGHIH